MMARETVFVGRGSRKLFFLLAACQMLAWAGDITENLYLLKWLKEPVIGDEFGRYHVIVISEMDRCIDRIFSFAGSNSHKA